jgi:heptosyltransferase-2/heptosyltransferase-3
LAKECGSPRVKAVADQLPLRRLFALLTRAHSMIRVDTGPAHAAAALGCAIVCGRRYFLRLTWR